MEANKILQSDVLDILFENRNKEYGAYELRKKYDKRIAKALLATGVIVFSFILGPILSKVFALKSNVTLDVPEVVVHSVEIEKAPPPVAPPPARTPPPPQIATTQFVPPVIKKDDDVKKNELPPVDEINKVDVKTQDGLNEDVISPPTVDNGKGIVETPKKDIESDDPFIKVEIEASVNMAAWRRYLENHLARYSEDAVNAGIATGQYTVQVRFIVERDGSITDVQALNDPGYGLAKGAVEVLKHGPNWSPGIQNGKKVRSYRTQPITFLISDQ